MENGDLHSPCSQAHPHSHSPHISAQHSDPPHSQAWSQDTYPDPQVRARESAQSFQQTRRQPSLINEGHLATTAICYLNIYTYIHTHTYSPVYFYITLNWWNDYTKNICESLFLFSFFQCLQKYQPRGTVDPPKWNKKPDVSQSAQSPTSSHLLVCVQHESPEDTDINTQPHLSSSHSLGTFLVVLQNLSAHSSS